MTRRVHYEWKIERVETASGDIVDTNHFDSLAAALAFVAGFPAEGFAFPRPAAGEHFDLCLVRDEYRFAPGDEENADHVDRSHAYLVSEGRRLAGFVLGEGDSEFAVPVRFIGEVSRVGI